MVPLGESAAVTLCVRHRTQNLPQTRKQAEARGGRAGEPDFRARGVRVASRASTHKVSNRSLAAPSKVSLCRFWNVSQRSRWSPRSSVATEDVGVAGCGGGSNASSGGGSPGPASWARGDSCLGRCFADGCLAAARLPPLAWPVGRRARLAPGAEAAAAGALEAPGRFCPRGSEDTVFRVCRMVPAAWRAGLATRASPQPRALPLRPARVPTRQSTCAPRGRCACPPRPRLLPTAPSCSRAAHSRRVGSSPARLQGCTCQLHPSGQTGPRLAPRLRTPRARSHLQRHLRPL